MAQEVENVTETKAKEADLSLVDNVELASDKLRTAATENANKLFTAIAAVLLVVVAIISYQRFVKTPAEISAAENIFMAQYWFEVKDFESALNGDDTYPGFLEIIEEHGGTKAANLSKFYAGLVYLNQGEYQLAVDMLEDFSSDDMFIGAHAYSALGDAYAEMQDSRATQYYKKAATHNSNEFTTPLYLMKLANALEIEGQTGEALGYYKMIKKQYPNSAEGKDIDKYIAKLETALN